MMVRGAYIAIDPKTREVIGAAKVIAGDSNGLSEFIRQGLIIDRVTMEEAKKFFSVGLPENWKI
jgi:hypothetical protein